MMSFLRPLTRVYVGKDFEVPAVIAQVTIRGSGEPVYNCHWWGDGALNEAWLERYEFALEQGVPGAENDLIELKEEEG